MANVRKKASGKVVRSIKGTGIGSHDDRWRGAAIPTDGAPIGAPAASA